MIITEARVRRRGFYCLVLDGEEGPLVDRATFDESRFRVGEAIGEDELEALLAESAYRRARERALYLLGLRDYACRELEKKLALQAPPEVAHAVVERLREVGLIDDERFATRFAAHLRREKQYPARRVEQELIRRGVDRAIAAAAAESESEDGDLQQALAILRKKYYNKMTDRVARERVMAALARRGFSYEVIRRAMNAPEWESQEDENEWQ